MSTAQIRFSSDLDAINRGFSKQSINYDVADRANGILQDLRQQVYCHVEKFIKPQSNILELNAGTGIDALHFTSLGHRVHATDLSDGMIARIKEKIRQHNLEGVMSCQQLSYDQLDKAAERQYDYIFSNFGGLNCIADLRRVTRHLPALLKPGGYVTWVIMPPICPWELVWIFKGKWAAAFRRLRKGGVMAHLEGEYFPTYYFSLNDLREAFGHSFKLVKCEGLAALSPPPHYDYLFSKSPGIYKTTRKIDSFFRGFFPFNRWADHIVVTFQRRNASQNN